MDDPPGSGERLRRGRWKPFDTNHGFDMSSPVPSQCDGCSEQDFRVTRLAPAQCPSPLTGALFFMSLTRGSSNPPVLMTSGPAPTLVGSTDEANAETPQGVSWSCPSRGITGSQQEGPRVKDIRRKATERPKLAVTYDPANLGDEHHTTSEFESRGGKCCNANYPSGLNPNNAWGCPMDVSKTV